MRPPDRPVAWETAAEQLTSQLVMVLSNRQVRAWQGTHEIVHAYLRGVPGHEIRVQLMIQHTRLVYYCADLDRVFGSIQDPQIVATRISTYLISSCTDLDADPCLERFGEC